ncbi:MAG: ADP-ribose pyrophosphatase [Verrucomicrobiota bacterium]|jgi:8-oxo-dGTP pyrophosphatase MutT (NUDIX family)
MTVDLDVTEPDKPNGISLGWRLRETAEVFTNKVLKARVDEIDVRGKPTQYAYIERAQAVVIVPVTRDGQIATVEQYRYPIDEWCIEIPAGGTHDTGDESLREVVRKELREEIGATSSVLTYVNFFYSGPSLSDEICHVFLAENVEVTEEPSTEATEEIRVKMMDAEDVLKLARSGKMKNGPCTLALLLCEPLLRERGYL